MDTMHLEQVDAHLTFVFSFCTRHACVVNNII